jgi:predicted MFS family arabinose efflux permease
MLANGAPSVRGFYPAMGKRDGQVYEWTLVLSLALMFGFVGLNRVGIGYVLPVIVDEFHLEFSLAGLLVSGTSLAWALSAWLSGSISDRVGRKKVLLIGMYGAAAISALIGTAWNFLSLFILRDILGLGDGVSLTTGQSTIAERTNPNRRALYQGIFNGGYNLLGLALGAYIITHLTTAFGWRWTFPLVGLFGVLVTTWLIYILPPELPAAARQAAGQLKPSVFVNDLRHILSSRGMAFTTLGFTLQLAWLGLNIAFYALFLVRVRGFTLNEAGDILALSAAVGLLGVLIIPALSDAIGRRRTGMLAAVIGGAAFLLFALLPMPRELLIPVLAVGSIAATGLGPMCGATLPSELVPERRGAAIGVCNLFAATLGITLSPVIGGALADRFGLMVPVVLAGVCIVLIAAALAGVPETAPRVLTRQAPAPQAPVAA